MPCSNPLTAVRQGGSITLLGARRRIPIPGDFLIPCGRCTDCRLSRSYEWSLRIMHEAQTSSCSCFVTLTYNDEFLPPAGGLRYEDFQRFVKRARLKFPFRYFVTGEYGEELRGHYHVAIFGYDFPDRRPWKRSRSGFDLCRSDLLESLWVDTKSGRSLGFSSIGELNRSTARYVASYSLKKVYGEQSTEYYSRVDSRTGEVVEVAPEFLRTSQGLGRAWFDRFGRSDIFLRDGLFVGGKPVKVPRYYDKLMQREAPAFFRHVKEKRLAAVKDDLAIIAENHRPMRLEARRQITEARQRHKKRGMS